MQKDRITHCPDAGIVGTTLTQCPDVIFKMHQHLAHNMLQQLFPTNSCQREIFIDKRNPVYIRIKIITNIGLVALHCLRNGTLSETIVIKRLIHMDYAAHFAHPAIQRGMIFIFYTFGEFTGIKETPVINPNTR